MKIVFVTNFINHHQKFLADRMYALTDRQYHFIATEEQSDQLKKFGYTQYENVPYYVFASEAEKDKCLSIVHNADVSIVGGAEKEWSKSRLAENKLIFRYTERPLKKGFELLKYPYRFVKWHRENPKGANIYLLCASAYASADFSKFFLYKNRMYKWGYFPETRHYDTENLFDNKNKTEILWCGRFLDWKHPDDAVRIARKLKADGCDFVLNIIGTGVMEETLRQMISDYSLEDRVHLLGALPQEKVREHMERAGICLFTSDRQEGWGAVLNEAMNSGCAVAASHAIGAVPYLMKNRENGLIYRSGDTDALYQNVKYLLDHPEEQRRLGEAAYRTITEEWNAEIAAERFIKLAQCILDGNKSPDLYKSGPCSKAEIIKDDT